MNELVPAVANAEQVLRFAEDNREYRVVISPDDWINITPWLLGRNFEKQNILTENGRTQVGIEDVHKLIAEKFTAARQNLNIDGQLELNFSYRELDSLFLLSFYEDPDYIQDDSIFRERMRKGDFDKAIAFHARYLKESLLHLTESFIEGGGKDRFGHFDTLTRVRPLRITTYLDDDGYCYFINDVRKSRR